MVMIASISNAQTFVMQGAATPTATLTSNDANDTICVGTGVIFNAGIQAGSTYQFSVNNTVMQGPGGSNTYIPVPDFITGNQQVVLLVNNGTCSARDTINFATIALPIPTLAVAPGNTVCAGTSVTFTAGGGVNYDFKVNGISMQNSASVTYTTSGLTNGQVVTVDVTNTGGCVATSAGITIAINPLPTPTLAAVPGNIVCTGTNVIFTAGGGVNYDFKVNGISVQNGVLATYATSALTNGQIVTVDVTNAGGCVATSAGITMAINPLPTVATVIGNPTPNCVGTNGNVTFTGLTGTAPWSLEVWTDVLGNPGVLYYAVPGTTAIPNTVISVPIPAVGNTILHFRITDANGCKNF